MIEFSEQLSGLEQSLMKYAYHLKLSNDDARDLVQETFLKALLSREKYVDTGFLKAWTMTIMRNTFINSYRHNVLHNTHCDRTDEEYYINQTKCSGSDDPDSVYSVMEITKSIEQLKGKFRVPFKMYVAGYRYREIADKFNLNLGTVKSRIFLARKVLINRINC
ncbi:MAG: RNA polymerase sigma factor [Bacteroidales bacterium]